MDYAASARRNMIDCQIRTNGITDESVLQALSSVPRDQFMPDGMRQFAYVDEDVMLGNGAFMLEPLVQARLLQIAAIKPGEKVLLVGDATGYAAALLAAMGAPADSATDISAVPADGAYDVILVCGKIGAVPDALEERLAARGRLVAIVPKPGFSNLGILCAFYKTGEGLSPHFHADASTPYLAGFEPKQEFVF